MPRIQKLNLDALRPQPRAARVAEPVAAPVAEVVADPGQFQQSPPQRSRVDWTKIGLICAIVALAMYIAFSRGVIPSPIPQPDIDVEGFYVMVIQPDSESGLDQGQKEFLRSAKIAEWVTSNGGEFRAYPQSQNIDAESDVWKEIRSELSPPHLVGVVNNRRLTKLVPPNGIDEGIRTLEKYK